MPLSQQLKGLLHNKWALAGVAGAAGLGGLVLYRKRKTGGSSGTSDTTTGQAAGNGVATLDTSGTDIASWLGQYGGSLQAQLDAYQAQLTSALQQLENMPTNGGTPTGGGYAAPPWLHPGGGRGAPTGTKTPPRWGGSPPRPKHPPVG